MQRARRSGGNFLGTGGVLWENRILVDRGVPAGTLATELGAVLAAIQGNLGSLANNYPVTASAPSGYVTYAGPVSPRDFGRLLQAGCSGEPVATIAPELVSGPVMFQPYWSSTGQRDSDWIRP